MFVGLIFGEGHLAAQRHLEVAAHLVVGEAFAKEVHQLGNGSLGGHVMPAYHAGTRQFPACQVAHGVHAPVRALRDVDDDDAAVDRIAYSVCEPFVSRAVARAERFHHYAFDMGSGEQMPHRSLGDAWEQVEYEHVGVHLIVNFQRAAHFLAPQSLLVVLYAEADFGELRIVV